MHLMKQFSIRRVFSLYFQTYHLFSINLVSQVTLRSSGTDILYGCHLLRCLYNILYFLWLYNEFFIILYNILKIAELDCCQIIILSICVPSTHAYTHVLCLSLDLPYKTRQHYDYWSSLFKEGMWSSGLGRWT
jgi:hypothetical protein